MEAMPHRAQIDPYSVSAFDVVNKLKRLTWRIAWLLLFRPTPVMLHGWRSLLLGMFGARIGASNYIYPTATIWAPWNLVTGCSVTIGPNAEVYNPALVDLAHHTIISQGSYLCGATHDYNSPTFTYVSKPIISGAYAWVCARSIVLPGVTLGEGSVLGAGSVASKNLDEWCVYAGNPAVKVKERRRDWQGVEGRNVS